MPQKVLFTVRQFNERHPAFTQGSIRNLIFHATTNGFDAALVRVGRRVLIDEAKFFEWVDAQNGRSAV